MSTEDKVLSEIYKGLRTFEKYSFPHKCLKCGKVYANLEEYLAQTEPLSNSTGLIEYREDNPVVALYRNCACKSTAMVYCYDRRDRSENGLKRREIFERLIETLKAAGLERHEAREELLKLLRGTK